VFKTGQICSSWCIAKNIGDTELWLSSMDSETCIFNFDFFYSV
jgi:hypothetical protein